MAATKVRFERNAMMSAAHLSHDDGGRGLIFCSIPGGRPWLQLSGGEPITIVNAPQCDTHAEFKAFVIERFVNTP